MPRIIPAVLMFALALTGCSGGSPLDKIKVGGSEKSPTLTVPPGFTVKATTTKVIDKGDGPELAGGDMAKVDFVAYNARTAKQFDDSFTGGATLTLQLTKGKALPGFIKALKGQPIGTRLVAAVPPIDGFASDRPEIGMRKSDTMVFYLSVVGKVPSAASGRKQALPADVPGVVMKDGRPTGFRKTATTPASLSEASSHLVIRGSGPKVLKGGTVVAHYLGQVFPQGAVFDSSWDRGAPSTFPLTGVIKCWQNLLPGVPVGSRIVLECPAADAYGDAPQPGGKIKPGDSLLFVVDVLDAQ